MVSIESFFEVKKNACNVTENLLERNLEKQQQNILAVVDNLQ